LKFLIDAQLPRRVARWLADSGGDAVHTLDLAKGNQTPDRDIIAIAESESRIVMTKDADFVDSHIIRGKPSKLLLISTGNITNRELELLMVPLIPTIIAEYQSASFLELSHVGLVVRG